MSYQNDREEQRAYKRFSADDNCWAQLGSSNKLTIKNISLFGTCLIVPQQLEKEIAYEISFHAGLAESVTLTGCVMWTYPMGTKLAADSEVAYFETGFKFMNMDESQQSALQSFIENLEE